MNGNKTRVCSYKANNAANRFLQFELRDIMRKYALLLGNSVFRDKRLNKLNAPSHDVNNLYNVLKNQNICGFDEVDNIVNSSAESAQTQILEFVKGKKRDDFIFVYYTGHGLIDDENEFYLAFSESNAEHPVIGSIRADWLKGRLDRCRSERQLLLLDCCHSGAIIDGEKSNSNKLVISEETFDRQGYGRYVLASSSRTQSSVEEDGKSLYTSAFVEGLRDGKAAPGKPQISIDDLEEYLSAQFTNSSAPMRPESEAKRKIGKIIIADNPAVQPLRHTELITINSDVVGNSASQEVDGKKSRNKEDVNYYELDEDNNHSELERLSPYLAEVHDKTSLINVFRQDDSMKEYYLRVLKKEKILYRLDQDSSITQSSKDNMEKLITQKFENFEKIRVFSILLISGATIPLLAFLLIAANEKNSKTLIFGLSITIAISLITIIVSMMGGRKFAKPHHSRWRIFLIGIVSVLSLFIILFVIGFLLDPRY